MNPPPKTVYVNGRSVPFRLATGTDGLPFAGQWGEADSTGATVIDSGQAGHVASVALHEIGHLALDASGIRAMLQAASESAEQAKSREEHVCDTFAAWLFMLLRDNPEFVDWLVELLRKARADLIVSVVKPRQ